MHGKRRDIQGLRAVAVLLVVANHLIGSPVGGFIGVDIFFVISGFLITQLLLNEHARTGRISFGDFYRRRIKRILPAATTVTVATVAVGFVVFAQTRFESVLVDGLWATLFSANWRFIALGTDYMHVNDAVSPLQHYWSLSIEEQFYFVWPIILLAVLTVVSTRKLRAAAIVISAFGLLSFTWAMFETATQPTWAYFSTFSRAWELAAGALLAIASGRLAAVPQQARPAIAWAGVAVMAAGVFLITPDSAFPGPFAVVPVVGACLVIAAGIGGPQRYLWPLTNRAVGYVGDISYSLYLWHFPVIVFAGLFLSETPRRLVVVALLLTVVLSVASYHFIENPMRLQMGRRRFFVPAMGVAGVLSLSLLAVSIAPQPSLAEEPKAAQSSPVVRAGGGDASRQLWQDIDRALQQRAWPPLEPSYDGTRSSDKAPEWVVDGCLGNEAGALPDPIANAERCHFGDSGAEKVAVVMGDSVAISWVPGIRAALEPLGYEIEVITAQQCPVANVHAQYNDGSDMTGCGELRSWALKRIAAIQPDLVVASSVPSTLSRLSSGSVGAAAQQEWETGMAATLTTLSESANRVVVLQSPPSRNGGDACALKNSVPSDCLLFRSESYALMDEADQRAATGLDVIYAPTSSWFCSLDGLCPAFTGTIPVTVDGPHLTADYSERLAPVLRGVLIDVLDK